MIHRTIYIGSTCCFENVIKIQKCKILFPVIVARVIQDQRIESAYFSMSEIKREIYIAETLVS